MTNWREPQIRHVCRFVYGDSLPDAERCDGGVSVYGSNGPVGTHTTPNTQGPAIVIGRKGSYGKLQFSEFPVFAIDTTFFIDPRSTDADMRWLFYALSALRLDELSFDVGVPGLSREQAYGRRIPLPPHKAQRAIADFLDAETARIDALIAKKRQQISIVGERFRGVLDRAFIRLDADEVPMGRFVVTFTQGISPQAEDRPYEPGEWGTLKLSSVKFGKYIPGENKALPPGYPVDPQLVPRRGDLLVTRSNTPSYVGDVCAVRKEDPRVVLCDLIYRARLDGRLCPEFAAYALLTTRSRWHLSGAARGTSQSMVKLRGEDVRATRIPLISTDDQEAIVWELDEHRKSTDQVLEKLARQIQFLQEQRQALITAAVSGKLEVPRAA